MVLVIKNYELELCELGQESLLQMKGTHQKCPGCRLCHRATGMYALAPQPVPALETVLQKTHWLQLFMNCTFPWLHMSKTVFKTHVIHEF